MDITQRRPRTISSQGIRYFQCKNKVRVGQNWHFLFGSLSWKPMLNFYILLFIWKVQIIKNIFSGGSFAPSGLSSGRPRRYLHTYCLATRGSFSNSTAAPDELNRRRIPSSLTRETFTVRRRRTPILLNTLKTRQIEELALIESRDEYRNSDGDHKARTPNWKVAMSDAVEISVPKWEGVWYLGELVRVVRPSTTRRSMIEVNRSSKRTDCCRHFLGHTRIYGRIER